MCNSDLQLTILPDVLQDIVLLYAYNVPKEAVLRSVNTLLDIKDMQLPFFFLKEKIWSWELQRFLPNPLIEFMPIEYYDSKFGEIFHKDCMYCFLLGLDFRRRNVRLFGTREAWFNRICSSWRTVEPFSAYYKMLLRSKSRISKKRRHLIRRMI